MTLKNKRLKRVEKMIKDGLWPPRTVCYLPKVKASIQTDEVPDDIYEVAFITGMEQMLAEDRIELTEAGNRHGARWKK